MDAEREGLISGVKEYMLWLLNIAFNMNYNISANYRWNIDTSILNKCGKKLALYGTGDVGKSFYDQLSAMKDIEVVAWFDKNCCGKTIRNREIISPKDINEYDHDSVIIAVAGNKLAETIKNDLVNSNVEEDRILWWNTTRDFTNWTFEI